MDYFKFSDSSKLSEFINLETEGQKFGEKVITISELNQLDGTDAEYVLFGIPRLSPFSETIEIENFDIFQKVLKILMNIQNNEFNRGENLLILGELDIEMLTKELDEVKSDSEKRNKFHSLLGTIITEIVLAICASGKIPIIIGGIPRNTFDILKGVSLSESTTINLLDLSTQFNFKLDQDVDLLQPNQIYYNAEFLNKLHSFGLHKNYITQRDFERIRSSKYLNHHFYEDCLHLTTLDKCIRFKNAIDFLNPKLGFKLDVTSIQGMSPHCDSSSGFSVRDIRTFIKVIRKEQAQFFHICGFEPDSKENISFPSSYFISDFMRSEA